MDDSASDVECCSEVVNTPIDVTTCKRLRSKDAAANTTPLLVTVKDPAQVWSALNTARKLGESDDYKSVFCKGRFHPFREGGFSQEVAGEN
jgi:hypothetical protein